MDVSYVWSATSGGGISYTGAATAGGINVSPSPNTPYVNVTSNGIYVTGHGSYTTTFTNGVNVLTPAVHLSPAQREKLMREHAYFELPDLASCAVCAALGETRYLSQHIFVIRGF